MNGAYRRHLPVAVVILLLDVYYAHDLSGGLWQDEVIYMKSGVSLLTGYPFVNPTHMHAPIGKVVFGVAQLFGGVVAARFASVVLGTGALVVVYYTTVRIVDTPMYGLVGVVVLGTLPVFVYRVPIALLGSTLALTMSLLVCCSLFAVRTNDEWWARAAGASATLVGASKLQGGLWAVAALCLFAHLHLRDAVDIREFLLGVFGALPVVYLPLFGMTAPSYYAGHSPPAFVETFGRIPWVGAVGYTYGATIVSNIKQITVNPTGVPPWIYLWWIVSEGGLPILFALGYLLYYYRDGRRPAERRVVAWLMLPFVVMLVVPVRAKKNLVPLFVPLVSLVGVMVRDAVEALDLSDRQARAAVVAVVVVVLLVPPGGVWLPANPAPDTAQDELYDRFSEQSDLRVSYLTLNVFDWYHGNRRYDNFTTNYGEEQEFDMDGDGETDLVMWDPQKGTNPDPDVCVRRTPSPSGDGEVYQAHVPHADKNVSYVVTEDC